MPDPGIFKYLLQHANADGSRSTAMNPLIWLVAAVLAALLTAANLEVQPTWIVPLLAGLTVVGVLAFLCAYFILLNKNPDALRSERFTLSKMAIESGLIGDSSKGFTAGAAKPVEANTVLIGSPGEEQ